MTPEQLAAEIASGPLAASLAPLVASGDDAGIAAALDAPSPSRSKSVPRVPISAVLVWAAAGPLGKLHDGAANQALPVQVRSICHACLLLFASPAVETLDLGGAAQRAMLGALAQAGVFSADDRASCLALATVSPASRAEELWGDGASVTQADVSFALRGDR